MGAFSKPFLSGRVPQEIWDAVNANARATGRTRTEVMIAAVSQYLEVVIPISKPQRQIADLEQELVALRQRLEASLEELSQRLSVIEAAKTDTPNKIFSTDEIWDKHYGNGTNSKKRKG